MFALWIRCVSLVLFPLLLYAGSFPLAGLLPGSPASVQQSTATELIGQVNALRASRGLAPYTPDASLMALAQEHSQYQASIHTPTHQHSSGNTPGELGIVENVACGDLGFLTPEFAVLQIWSDAIHMHTMVDFAAGSIGAGVANDGFTEYYTLEVRPAGTAPPTSGPNQGARTSTSRPSTPGTPIPLVPLTTSTPRPDGAVVHPVGYGQTLWSIALAYHITVDQIRQWNIALTGSNDLYAGQKLLVRPAGLVTVSASPSPPPPATPSFTADPNPTASPTPEPTGTKPIVPSPLAPTLAPPSRPLANLSLPLGAAAVILAGCVLLVVLFAQKK
jgi:LysM repeat protein